MRILIVVGILPTVVRAQPGEAESRPSVTPTPAPAVVPRIVSLSESIQPFVESFNDQPAQLRYVGLFSPS